jgi:hypothetical protein
VLAAAKSPPSPSAQTGEPFVEAPLVEPEEPVVAAPPVEVPPALPLLEETPPTLDDEEADPLPADVAPRGVEREDEQAVARK